jgi:hypothetical protein
MRQELEELQSRFEPKEQPDAAGQPKEQPDAAGEPEDAGELLVLFEDGFAPQKQEVKIPFPLPEAGVVAIAFPMYAPRWDAPKPLALRRGELSLGCTETICDIRALAVKSLQEKAQALALRQTLRAIAKGASVKLAEEKLGPLGSLGANIWNLASENADLRSWLTLPETAQIMRVSLPAGRHSLTLGYDQPSISANVGLEIKQGGKTLLRVVRAGARMYSSVSAF